MFRACGMSDGALFKGIAEAARRLGVALPAVLAA
jgi:hypothetical protein